MTKYSDGLISKVICEYINGESIPNLSSKYGIHDSTIRKWLKKRNIPDNHTGRFSQKYEIVDDHAEIYIKSKGAYVKALIDIEDINRCKQFGIWSVTKGGYVVNCKTNTYLHRFIMNCPENMEVDHKSHNTLDNRKSELRIATSSQQKMNTHIRKDNKSGHRGVYYDKQRNTWNVHLKNGSRRITKRFKTFNDAVSFCEEKIKEIQKEFRYEQGGVQ